MNILLASTDLGPRAGLTRLQERLPDVRVVGETSTGAGANRLARKGRPAVVLIGSTPERASCLETVRSIRTISPRTQFIVPSLVALAFRDYLAVTERRKYKLRLEVR